MNLIQRAESRLHQRLGSQALSIRTLVFVCALIVAMPSAHAQERRLVTADALKLRAEPSAESQVLSTLPRGHPVLEVERTGGWSRIATFVPNGGRFTYGWVASRYLQSPEGSRPPQSSDPRFYARDGLIIADVELDCDEDYIQGGWDDCEVEVSLQLHGPSWVESSASVKCEVELRITDSSGYQTTASESEWTTIYVSGGYGSTTLTVDVDVSPMYLDPVVRVGLDNVDCRM
jgi:hypothetical protein